MDRVSSMLSFVRVVDTGGFSAAARQLNLATSVVTTHVKWLEERLGVRLLNRTTRSVSLTDAGRAYYERCVQILSEIEDADEAAQMLQSKPRGILRLNTSPGMPEIIAPSMAEYSALYPDVTVHLTATSRMLDLVEEGFDLAIWYAPVGDPGLIVRHLAHFRMIVCASPAYIAKHGRPEHPSHPTKHNGVVFYDAPNLGRQGRDWQFTGPDGDFSVHVSGTLETNSATAFRLAAVQGQGLILAPAPLVHNDLCAGTLVPLLREYLPKQLSIDALYPNREHLPAKIRTLIDLLIKNFRQIDWDSCGSEDKSPSKPAAQTAAASRPRAAPKERTPG